MQNRYTGDIGDFGKLGLLRALQASGLTVGVNWYLVPDENHNSDGRHVQYLENADYCQLDEPLEWARANALPQPYSPNTPIILSSSISAGLENT